MSQQIDSTLDTKAVEIRDETTLNANTPTRVGTWMKDLNDSKVNNLDLALKAAPEVTKAQLIGFITDSTVQKKPYKITDSAYGIILLWGISTTDISAFAIKLGNVSPTSIYGYCGNYFIGTDVFVEQGRIPTAPTVTNDLAHGFYVGQYLKTLDSGFTYICKDAINGAAVWELDPSQSVAWSKSLTSANIIAAGAFDIAELPAIPGYYWNIDTVTFAYTHGGVDFDGGSKISIQVNGAPSPMFIDATEILASTATIRGRLTTAEQIGGTVNDCILGNAKVQVFLNNPSTAGNGSLKLQGTARIIKL